MKASDDEFTRAAESILLRCLGEWNGIDSALSRRERLAIELTLLTKLQAMLARDGLKIGVDLMCRLVRDVWEAETHHGSVEQTGMT